MALQPGSAVPASAVELAGQPAPADTVRIALYYGINWGYTESDPEQAVLAVWYAQDQTWRSEKHSAAEQIYTAAASSQGTPSWSPNGRSALQLASGGQLKLGEIALTPLQQTPAMGTGTLLLTNTSSQELLVYLPYGTIFGEGLSAVLVWATGELRQAQPSATQEAQPTYTVETVESAPTDTPVPTATATVAAPDSPGKKGGATSTATNTPVAVVEATQEPSATAQTVTKQNAPDTPTALPENTATPTTTNTVAPTDTPTTEPTSTSTPVPPVPTAATSKVEGNTEQTSSAAVAADAAPQPNQAPSSVASNAAPADQQPSKSQSNVQAPAPPAEADPGAQEQAPAPAGDASKNATTQEGSEIASIAGKQSSNTEALAPVVTLTTVPRAVQTTVSSAGDTNAAPRAVQTSGATPPPPVQTGNATEPVSTGVPSSPTAIRTGTPTRVRTGTPASTATIEPGLTDPEPTATRESIPTATVDEPVLREPTEEVPTVPVRETQAPVPTPFTEIEPTPTLPVPEIVTGGDDGVQVGSDGGGEVPAVSPPPAVNPRTGGGPSSLPLWLSLSSLALVLSGAHLRRLAARQHNPNR